MAGQNSNECIILFGILFDWTVFYRDSWQPSNPSYFAFVRDARNQEIPIHPGPIASKFELIVLNCILHRSRLYKPL